MTRRFGYEPWYEKVPVVGAAAGIISGGLIGLILTLAVISTVAAGIVSFASGAVFYFAWNHGVVHFLATLGAHVGGVTYWTSYFTAWFLTTFVGTLKGVQMQTSK